MLWRALRSAPFWSLHASGRNSHPVNAKAISRRSRERPSKVRLQWSIRPARPRKSSLKMHSLHPKPWNKSKKGPLTIHSSVGMPTWPSREYRLRPLECTRRSILSLVANPALRWSLISQYLWRIQGRLNTTSCEHWRKQSYHNLSSHRCLSWTRRAVMIFLS